MGLINSRFERVDTGPNLPPYEKLRALPHVKLRTLLYVRLGSIHESLIRSVRKIMFCRDKTNVASQSWQGAEIRYPESVC